MTIQLHDPAQGTHHESSQSVRPLGMRYLVAVEPRQLADAGQARAYDAVRQLTVTPSGDPWARYADVQRMESTTETSTDGQTSDVTDPY